MSIHKVALIGVLFVLICCTVHSTAIPQRLARIVDHVNAANAGWKAGTPPAHLQSHDDVASLCGAMSDGRVLKSTAPLEDALPENFDSRTAWPNCTVIGKVGSQAGCGDCWAWSATQTYESFLCIKGELPPSTELSKEDTAECCTGALCGYSKSCTAGTPSAALLWMSRNGVVTGGGYNSTTGCKPYPLAPCSVDPTDPKDHLPTCHNPKPPLSPTCQSKCSNPRYATPYASDKMGASSGHSPDGLSYRDDNQTHAMKYIVENGPVAATFTVMGDFPTYRSGIYTHVTGAALGGHAITIVGFGIENGTKYWTVKNSWSKYWGANGYFRIRRGTDECGIESHLTGLRALH